MLSILFAYCGAAMIIPAFTAALYGEVNESKFFIAAAVVLIISGGVTSKLLSQHATSFKMRDSYLLVFLCWFLLSVISAVPYIACGVSATPIDAFFEAVSSLTTTGCTLFDMNNAPFSIIMWKNLCNWFGGMGILILLISIVPSLGVGGKYIASAEAASANLEHVFTKTGEAAKSVYIIYMLFTAIEFFLLLMGPMDAFDALQNTLASISTSGMPYSSHSFASYNDYYSEAIVNAFNILGAVNFTMYYLLKSGKWRTVLKNSELRFFLGMILLCSIAVSANFYFSGRHSMVEAVRYGFFHVINAGTTTGVTIMDTSQLSTFTVVIFVALMLIGGCSFSTSGSLKVSRIIVLLKLVSRGFYRRLHPRAVVAVKVDDKAISAPRVSYLTVYILVYFVMILLGALVLSLQNLDLLTTLSSSLGMLSNVGLGFGQTATGDFNIFCQPLKLVLCFLMFAGRLEILTLVVLFMPSFWNPDKHRGL